MGPGCDGARPAEVGSARYWERAGHGNHGTPGPQLYRDYTATALLLIKGPRGPRMPAATRAQGAMMAGGS